MGFPSQEYCRGLPFPSLRDLPNPEIELASPTLADDFFTTEPSGKPIRITDWATYIFQHTADKKAKPLCFPGAAENTNSPPFTNLSIRKEAGP